MSLQLATFGAGCFWGVEELFRKLPGVTKTQVGYIGGEFENPTYEAVCRGTTGHAEVVQITYDPTIIQYKELLDLFWANHNPTTLNRQGPDIGHQYRSAIFYHTKEQHEKAMQSKDNLAKSGKFSNPIVTEIVPATTFYPAEEYHQQYLAKRELDNCHI